MAPQEYLESYFRVRVTINFLQSLIVIIESAPLVEDISSGVLGSGEPAAIAGRTRFKHLIQCDTSPSFGGVGIFSIAWINGVTEASNCSIELKKQVLPIFRRVLLNKRMPESFDFVC